jgi:hypothetical protein
VTQEPRREETTEQPGLLARLAVGADVIAGVVAAAKPERRVVTAAVG